MKEPPVAEAERCIELRIRSKQGNPDMSKEARAFINRMCKDYNEWYKSTEREVFYRSAPFGAQLPPFEKE